MPCTLVSRVSTALPTDPPPRHVFHLMMTLQTPFTCHRPRVYIRQHPLCNQPQDPPSCLQENQIRDDYCQNHRASALALGNRTQILRNNGGVLAFEFPRFIPELVVCFIERCHVLIAVCIRTRYLAVSFHALLVVGQVVKGFICLSVRRIWSVDGVLEVILGQEEVRCLAIPKVY